MGFNQKELLIMSHLRENSRKNLTKISKETKIAVSTIFDKIKKYEGGIIKKHTCILDFTKLGFDVRVKMILKCPRPNRDEIQEFLVRHPRVNSVYKINNGYDFLIEGIFRHMKDLSEFTEKLDGYKVKDRHEYFVLEDLKIESFLSDPSYIEMVGI
ncbi:Lrp/AsnC family transcriptional regulator [Candidatus Woesearchaeota archaeon]|jgi:Lrp/AsnC family transcriptional regulator, leucine-responsive regulatory protein|nr:Lrp/AsnC family transcriptional regulator [Candidatus Woesearchaeota archaeon]MBT3537659.1 Lrp/AsnC family transcriptional regulator [Candidatus Woesearchaeota archaeon]MBT4698093.1 Lrp/AsnC family transcriptional regulator [Candidatus Woesearchaeota archaeon]MBT4717197.1 Lrp/AsnC family transcriptional regulator [Candidatus Woesearchaeota archaeon]MBT7105328.1 Lrp/AsnC family transcriptional regulator [Candidatus Woesearchaeota archaeon]